MAFISTKFACKLICSWTWLAAFFSATSNIVVNNSRYFEGGVSSVYFWDLDYGFAGVVLIKKIGDGCRLIQGCWDSIHVIEIQEKVTSPVKYSRLFW